MKMWILPDNSDPTKYAVVGSTVRPKNAVCEAPVGAEVTDGKYITVQDVVEDIDGEDQVVGQAAVLDQASKDADFVAEQAAKDSVQYQEDRRLAYPSIGDQLDALYKKLYLNDSTEYNAIAAQIAQVKLDYPKPE